MPTSDFRFLTSDFPSIPRLRSGSNPERLHGILKVESKDSTSTFGSFRLRTAELAQDCARGDETWLGLRSWELFKNSVFYTTVRSKKTDFYLMPTSDL